MKHIHTFENFLNEANVFNNFSAQEKKAWKNVQKLNESYSSSDIKKLEEFAEELSDEIRDNEPLNYRDYEDFSPENFFEYITGEGYGTSRSKFGEDKNLKTAADVIKKYNSIIRPLTVKKLKKEMGL